VELAVIIAIGLALLVAVNAGNAQRGRRGRR